MQIERSSCFRFIHLFTGMSSAICHRATFHFSLSDQSSTFLLTFAKVPLQCSHDRQHYISPRASPIFTCRVAVAVTGCADISAPDHAWLERRADTVQVACNHTSERWHLVCKGVDWVGEFGNCTSGPARPGTDSSRIHIGTSAS